MNFDYEGMKYWITFRHDPDLSLAAHYGHKIYIGYQVHGGLKVKCNTCKNWNGEGLVLLPLPKKYKRATHCAIKTLNGTKLVDIAKGSSKLNTDEGDHFCRSEGRKASLETALVERVDEFYEAAWRCYMAWGK
jgi:hypothetical protein